MTFLISSQISALIIFVLGEVPVGGELHLVVLGIFDHGVFIDHDQTGDKFSPVTDDDRIVDIDAGLEFVFDKLGGDVFAAGGDDDILFPVGDFQVTVCIDLPNISRVQPSVFDGFRGGCRGF